MKKIGIQMRSCLLFALSTMLFFYANAMASFAFQYDDITGHWAESTIRTVSELRLFVGTGNRTFMPDKDTTRAEFVAVMTRALNPEVEKIEASYPYWATKYLLFARDKGYIPQDYDISEEYCSLPISRLEMIRLLALMIEKLEIPHDVVPPTITDMNELDESDVKIIDFVMTTGVIKGHDQKVMPYKTTGRAELATVILQMYRKSPLTSNSGSSNTASGSSNTGSKVTGAEKSGTSDAGYRIGEFFRESDAVSSYRVNSALTWKFLEQPETGVFSFVIVNQEGEVVARSVSSLPASDTVSVLKSFPYIEYAYSNATFFDYREWGDKTGEDGSIVIIEINPLYKRQFDISPQSADEVYGFERVAEYITNVYRVKKGRSVLKYREELHAFAKNFSNTMDEGNFFSHDVPGDPSFIERVRAAGMGQLGIAENIAYGYPEPIYLIHAWINSPPHRNNILGDFNNIGIGIKTSRFKGILATQNFTRE